MIKRFIYQIHLWLGLISGLGLFIIATTGCLYAFKEEILNATEEFRFVEPQNSEFLLPSALIDIAQKELPGKLLHSVKYNGETKAAEAIFYHYEPTYYNIIYLNPYSGEVLHIKDMEAGFFHFVMDGHFYLWMPPAIGQPVVATLTLIFLLIVISGIIIWLPKNLKLIKERLWFYWSPKSKWKKRNYDLHNVIGFYVSLYALLFIFTGLVWGFQWYAKGYYSLMGGKKSLSYQEPTSKPNELQKEENALDELYLSIKSSTPDAQSIEVHPPATDSSAISIAINPDISTYWQTDYRYFDQHTLEEITVDHIYGSFKNTTVADKVMRMNYDLHTGGIIGITGKIIAFVMSLLIASLPVTGMIIWLNGRKKRKKRVGE